MSTNSHHYLKALKISCHNLLPSPCHLWMYSESSFFLKHKQIKSQVYSKSYKISHTNKKMYVIISIILLEVDLCLRSPDHNALWTYLATILWHMMAIFHLTWKRSQLEMGNMHTYFPTSVTKPGYSWGIFYKVFHILCFIFVNWWYLT